MPNNTQNICRTTSTDLIAVFSWQKNTAEKAFPQTWDWNKSSRKPTKSSSQDLPRIADFAKSFWIQAVKVSNTWSVVLLMSIKIGKMLQKIKTGSKIRQLLNIYDLNFWSFEIFENYHYWTDNKTHKWNNKSIGNSIIIFRIHNSCKCN